MFNLKLRIPGVFRLGRKLAAKIQARAKIVIFLILNLNDQRNVDFRFIIQSGCFDLNKNQ